MFQSTAPIRDQNGIAYPSFLETVVLNYGPSALLGRFLLAADMEARQRGVFLRFATFDELVKVNEDNRDTWGPTLPQYNPRYGTIDPGRAICMLGHADNGDVVLTQVARRYDWPDTTLADEIESLRLFYGNPAAMKGAHEWAQVTAPSAHSITGCVVFTGGHWCRPDYRSKGLTGITPRVARALALGWWDVEFACTFMTPEIHGRGVALRAGYANVEWGVTLHDNPVELEDLALLWSDRWGIIRELEAFLAAKGDDANPTAQQTSDTVSNSSRSPERMTGRTNRS